MIIDLQKELRLLADPQKAKILARFFKTGKGEYGEGDKLLGIVVPTQRQVAKKYQDLSPKDLQALLNSPIHEKRLVSLLILLMQYKKGSDERKKELVDFYLKNTPSINNWDLVDLSCGYILGDYLLNKDRSILYKFAVSKNIWERRIAIITTFWFIRNNQFEDTFKIAKLLLKDSHDLIHKAVGWMLREVGKRDQEKEEEFLKKYYKIMPRTALRYAIEKFNAQKRKFYLRK